nr:TonB-dependent receptor [Halorhodospira halophila]
MPVVRVESSVDSLGRGSSREEFQRRQSSRSGELFRGDASATVGGGSRNAQRLYLRGVESNNLNVTVDGARQGRDLHQHRGGLTGLDPQLLDDVEVDTRPAADQGPGALGGSVRFRTVDAQQLLDPDEQTGARLRAGYATADSSEQGSATVFQRLGFDWGALAHVSGANRDDYETGGGDNMPYSGGGDRSYLLQASRMPVHGHELRLGVQRHSFEGDTLSGGAGSDFGDPRVEHRGEPEKQELRRDTWTVEHRYDPTDPNVDWQARVYRNDNRLKRLDQGTETRALEHGGDLRNTFSLNAGPTRHQLTAGFDYYTEDGRLEQDDGPRLSYTDRNFGAFLQNRMEWERLRLSSGLRFDDYTSALGERNPEGDAFSPNLSAELDLAAGWAVFGGYGEAARGPGGTMPIGWVQYIEEGNDDQSLKTEESRRSEGGLRYQGRGLVASRDRLNLEATVFETRIDNSLERVGGGPPHQSGVRLGQRDVRISGYELRAAWGVNAYDTRLSFLSAETEDDDGDPAGVSRRLAGSGGDRLVWDHRWAAHETLTLGYTLTWVGDDTDVPDDEPERDGYHLHDIQVQWQPWADEQVTLGVVVNNLFDEQYAEHTSLVSEQDGELIVRDEPGRDIRLEAALRF